MMSTLSTGSSTSSTLPIFVQSEKDLVEKWGSFLGVIWRIHKNVTMDERDAVVKSVVCNNLPGGVDNAGALNTVHFLCASLWRKHGEYASTATNVKDDFVSKEMRIFEYGVAVSPEYGVSVSPPLVTPSVVLFN
jgi:hypothetical protein